MNEISEMLKRKDSERYEGEFVPFQGKKPKRHTPAEYDPAWIPGNGEEEE